jgi:hypothetical protein
VLLEWNFDIEDVVIDLSNHEIQTIDSKTFCDFQNLEELNLSRNKLKRIEVNLFKGLTNLKVLGN